MPVTGFAANFSPIPRIAPPLLGKLSEGNDAELDGASGGLTEFSRPDFSLPASLRFTESAFGLMTFRPPNQILQGVPRRIQTNPWKENVTPIDRWKKLPNKVGTKRRETPRS